jgi:hypothetical protein
VEHELRRLQETVERPPQAEGHLVAADALPETDIAAQSLGDRRAEAVVVAETADRAIVHLRRDDLAPLKRKISDYANPEKRTSRGRPRNEALVAPLEGLRLATLADLSDGTLTEAGVEGDEVYWVELWARGGRLEDEDVRERVRAEIVWLAEANGVAEHRIRMFRATERDVYLLPLPGRALHDLPVRVPEIYRVVPASPALRDLIVSENAAALVHPDEVQAPPDDAPSVVVLDTGVAPEHALLSPALVSPGHSVVVGDPSPIDTHGHGTEMAGLAGYRDLGGSCSRARQCNRGPDCRAFGCWRATNRTTTTAISGPSERTKLCELPKERAPNAVSSTSA